MLPCRGADLVRVRFRVRVRVRVRVRARVRVRVRVRRVRVRPHLRQAAAGEHVHDVAVTEWLDERGGMAVDLTRDRVPSHRGVDA